MNGRIISLAGDGRESALEPSDEELLNGCAAGQGQALAALFDRHAEDVHRFLARLRATDASDLDDLVQLTFLEVQRSARRFQGHAAPRTWLLAIAANVARLHARSARRRRGWLGLLAGLPAPRVPSPEKIVERRQLVRRLEAALARLPHDLRVAFVMCDVEEIAAVEVARGLGVPPGTVWRRLHQARKSLRAALEGGS